MISLTSITTELVEQLGIMNTNVKSKISSEYVSNVKGSDYEFNRFDKTALREAINVLKLLVVTISYSGWSEAATLIFDAVAKKFSSSQVDVYCFISSPAWKKNTSLVRRYGLGRALSKDFEVGQLDFLIEKEIINNNDVIFYGVVKLTSRNARGIFNLLSKNENGVLFSSLGPDDHDFILMVEELSSLVEIKSKTLTFNLDIVEAINIIVNKGSVAIYPYAWEETGEYHLDMFESL